MLHISPIPSGIGGDLIPQAPKMQSEGPIFEVRSMTRPGSDPTIFQSQGGHSATALVLWHHVPSVSLTK